MIWQYFYIEKILFDKKTPEFLRNLQKPASEYNNAIVLTWLHHVKRARNQACFIAHEAINIVARIFALTACVAGLLYIAYIYDARPRVLLMSEFSNHGGISGQVIWRNTWFWSYHITFSEPLLWISIRGCYLLKASKFYGCQATVH